MTAIPDDSEEEANEDDVFDSRCAAASGMLPS
jgi:hypothetical protein